MPTSPRKLLNSLRSDLNNGIKKEIETNSLPYLERENFKHVFQEHDLYPRRHQLKGVNTDIELSLVKVEEETFYPNNINYKSPELVVKIPKLNVVEKSGKFTVLSKSSSCNKISGKYQFVKSCSGNLTYLIKTEEKTCQKKTISKPPELVEKLPRIKLTERNGQFLVVSKLPSSSCSFSNLEYNKCNRTRWEQPNSSNLTVSLEHENKLEHGNDEMNGECDEWIIKQEEVHIKSEDEEGDRQEQSSSEHFTGSLESENNINSKNEKMNDEEFIKQVEMNMKSEDEKDNSKMALSDLADYRHSGNGILENFKCDVRPLQIIRKASLKLHVVTPENMEKCYQCSFHTKRITDLKMHERIHDNLEHIKAFKGNKSSFQTIYKNTVNSHILTHKSVFKCDHCSFQTTHKSSLINHAVIHKSTEDLTVFKCNECLFQTIRKGSLKCHLVTDRSTEELPIFRCMQCLFQTIHKKSLRKHLVAHKSMEKLTIFRCKQCSFQTIHKGTLTKHSVTHKSTDELSLLKCKQCSFQTIHKGSLKKHALTHKSTEELTIFNCSQCSFQTIHKQSLKRHAVIHKSTEELPMFKCNQCSFQTIRKANLKSHAIIHKSTEELPMFKCNQCSFQTIRKGSLTKHAVTHKSIEELTMFKCMQCLYQTVHKSGLKKHAVIHKSTEELTIFNCSQCSFQTIRKASLKSHAATHKRIEELDE